MSAVILKHLYLFFFLSVFTDLLPTYTPMSLQTTVNGKHKHKISWVKDLGPTVCALKKKLSITGDNLHFCTPTIRHLDEYIYKYLIHIFF